MPPLTGLSGGPSELQVVDLLLSNVARQYRPHGFIYSQIIAPQPVEYNHGKYPVFDLGKFFAATGQAAVADDAATPMIDANWGTEPFSCEDYRLKTRITRKELNQVNPALRLEMSKTLLLLSIMALEREIRLATALQPTSVAGGKLVLAYVEPAGAKWDEGTEAVPAKIQKDLQVNGQAVYKKTGLRPNTLVITEQIALAISQDPAVINIIKYLGGVEFVQSGNIDPRENGLQGVAGNSAVLPKKLWGFDVICADGVLQNVTPQGVTATLNEVWGNQARLLYVNKDAAWGIPTIVYGFRGKIAGAFQDALSVQPGSITQEEPGGTGDWAVVDRWQEPDPPAENIRAWECIDEHVVAPEAGIVLNNVLGKP